LKEGSIPGVWRAEWARHDVHVQKEEGRYTPVREEDRWLFGSKEGRCKGKHEKKGKALLILVVQDS